MNNKPTQYLVAGILAATLVHTHAAGLSGSTLDFNVLDKNGDGKITRAEFERANLPAVGAGTGSAGKSDVSSIAKPAAKGTNQNFTLRKSAFGVAQSGANRVGPQFADKFPTEPAELKWTRTGGGKESYAIDAGVAVRISPWKMADDEQAKFLAWLGVDYHRNSALDDRKDIIRGGLSFDWAPTPFDAAFGINPTLDVFFENDNVKDVQSFNTAVTLTPFADLWLFSKDTDIIPGVLRGKLTPSATIAFKTTTDTAAGVGSGDLIFGKFNAEFQGFVAPDIIHETLEVRTGYTHWEPFTSSGVYDGFDSSGMFSASVTFNFANGYWFRGAGPQNTFLSRDLTSTTLRDVKMGLKLEYTSGDDPEMGVKDADVVTLSLTAFY